MMLSVTIVTNINNNSFLTTFLIMMMDGKDRTVTAIIKDNAVPMPTPFKTSASAMGNVPNMSAYIGMPTKVANRTENGLFEPKTVIIQD